MITHTCNPLPSIQPGSAAPADTDSIISAGIQDELRRGRLTAMPGKAEEALVDEGKDKGGSLNLRPAGESAGEAPNATVMETVADKLPGQGMKPTATVSDESPKITPQDVKMIDGEGNLTDAASEVDSLEGGDTPGAGDGGDSGGAAVGMDYQAPGPDAPYLDGPGNPSSDPLTPQVASITPPPTDTALREPTAISGEIGGRLTDDQSDSAVLSFNAVPAKKEGGHESPPKDYPKDKKHYADPANYRYPIDTEEHVRAAWSYIHQQKNAHGFSPSELASVKGRIRTAAHRFGIQLSE